MKIKISKATPSQLDWLITKCEGIYWSLNGYFVWNTLGHLVKYSKECPAYSTDWSLAGPIIKREKIGIWWDGMWHAKYDGSKPTEVQDAYTPLIAAMRCYVANKLGNEVEIPKEI